MWPLPRCSNLRHSGIGGSNATIDWVQSVALRGGVWCFQYCALPQPFFGGSSQLPETSLEEQMVSRGAARYNRRVAGAEARGRVSDQSKAAQGLVGLLVSVAQQSLREEIGKPIAGRMQSSNRRIEECGIDRAVALAAKILVDRCAFSVERQNLSSLLLSVGGACHDQAWMEKFSHLKGPRLLDAIKARNQDSLFGTSKLKNLVRSQLGAEWEDWTRGEQLKVGAKLITHVVWASDLFEICKGRVGRKTKTWVQPSPELLRRLRKQDIRIALASPMLLPMDSEPEPWVGVTDGGYRTITMPLVKDSYGARLQSLAECEMPEVYQAVNALQRVAYAINQDVLVVAETLWKEGSTIAGLPQQDKLPAPAFPQDQAGLKWHELTEEQQEARQSWKSQASAVHAQDRANMGKSLSTRQTLEVAAQFEHRDVFFPMQLDFRGRCYAMPGFSPMGDKLTKSLIKFRDPQPITAEGAPWYMIHGANCWGLDKEEFEDRTAWVLKNRDRIIECAMDPTEDTWWCGAAEPWPFLAWMLEAARWFEGGQDFEFLSHIPCAMDQTCSALQHWSAALADTDGATRVNLCGGPRRDVYRDTLEVMHTLLSEQGDDPVAVFLLASPYWGRKLCKTPTMARTYGGTKRGVEDHVRRHMMQVDRMAAFRAIQSEEITINMVCRKVGGWVWEAINRSLTGAQQGMEFSMAVARVANHIGAPLSWTTDTGFLVQTAYWETKDRRIQTHLMGEVYTPALKEVTSKLSKRQQVSAIAPNLIHAQDAALLVRAVNAGGGIDVMTIHDSFGVHACHAPQFNEVLRREFVRLYEGRNFLEDWLKSALPSQLITGCSPSARKMLDELNPPPLGDLDLAQVLDARYAFS